MNICTILDYFIIFISIQLRLYYFLCEKWSQDCVQLSQFGRRQSFFPVAGVTTINGSSKNREREKKLLLLLRSVINF